MFIPGQQAVSAEVGCTLRGGRNTRHFVVSVTINYEEYIALRGPKFCYPDMPFGALILSW